MLSITGRKTIALTTKEKKEIGKILKSKQPVLRVMNRYFNTFHLLKY